MKTQEEPTKVQQSQHQNKGGQVVAKPKEKAFSKKLTQMSECFVHCIIQCFPTHKCIVSQFLSVTCLPLRLYFCTRYVCSTILATRIACICLPLPLDVFLVWVIASKIPHQKASQTRTIEMQPLQPRHDNSCRWPLYMPTRRHDLLRYNVHERDQNNKGFLMQLQFANVFYLRYCTGNRRQYVPMSLRILPSWSA